MVPAPGIPRTFDTVQRPRSSQPHTLVTAGPAARLQHHGHQSATTVTNLRAPAPDASAGAGADSANRPPDRCPSTRRRGVDRWQIRCRPTGVRITAYGTSRAGSSLRHQRPNGTHVLPRDLRLVRARGRRRRAGRAGRPLTTWSRSAGPSMAPDVQGPRDGDPEDRRIRPRRPTRAPQMAVVETIAIGHVPLRPLP